MTTIRKILFAITTGSSACAGTYHTALPVETRNDVLSHYMRGDSLENIADEFHLHGRDDARAAVHDAMLSLTKRYYADR
jgi:hypothetical protein